MTIGAISRARTRFALSMGGAGAGSGDFEPRPTVVESPSQAGVSHEARLAPIRRVHPGAHPDRHARSSAGRRGAPTITLTRTGTDQPLPIGTTFNVSIPITPNTTFVRPMFVRTDRPVWGIIKTGISCNALSKILDAKFGLQAGDTPAISLDASGQKPDPSHLALFDVLSGQRRLGSASERLFHIKNAVSDWNAHERKRKQSALSQGEIDALPILLTQPWVKPPAAASGTASTGASTPPAPISLTIPTSTFFYFGATYCVFVYEEETKPSDLLIRKIMKNYGDDLMTCPQNGPHDPSTTCATQAFNTFEKGLKGTIAHYAPTKPELTQLATDKIQDLLNDELLSAEQNLVDAVRNVGIELSVSPSSLASSEVVQSLKGSPLFPADMPDGNARINGTNGECPEFKGSKMPCHFARVLLDVLAAQGAIIPEQDAPPYSAVEPGVNVNVGNSLAATVIVPGMKYRAAFEIDRVGYDTAMKNVLLLPANSKSITTVPLDFSTATLFGTTVTLLDLINLANKKLRWGGSYYGSDDLWKQLGPLMTKREQITAGDEPALFSFQTWFQDIITLTTSTESRALQAWFADDVFKDLLPAQNASSALSSTVAALKVLDSNETSITTTLVNELNPVNGATELKASMQQTDFFTQYLIPSVGVAFINTPEGLLPSGYVALQAYFFPNPVNDLMWSHGCDDWRRIFAVEFGISMLSGNMDPLKRYTGLLTLGNRPVFLGAVLQPLPYTSISLGASFFTARMTTLPQETLQTTAAFYFSLSVQANVFDLLRKALANEGVSAINPVNP